MLRKFFATKCSNNAILRNRKLQFSQPFLRVVWKTRAKKVLPKLSEMLISMVPARSVSCSCSPCTRRCCSAGWQWQWGRRSCTRERDTDPTPVTINESTIRTHRLRVSTVNCEGILGQRKTYRYRTLANTLKKLSFLQCIGSSLI